MDVRTNGQPNVEAVMKKMHPAALSVEVKEPMQYPMEEMMEPTV
jgi:hypothetical protein